MSFCVLAQLQQSGFIDRSRFMVDAPVVGITASQLIGLAVAYLLGRGELTGGSLATHCPHVVCEPCPPPVGWVYWLRCHLISFSAGVVFALIGSFWCLRRASAVNVFFDQRAVNVPGPQTIPSAPPAASGLSSGAVENVVTPSSLRIRNGGAGHT